MVARFLTVVLAVMLLFGSVTAQRGQPPAEPLAALVEAPATDFDEVSLPAPPLAAVSPRHVALAAPEPMRGAGRMHADPIFRPPQAND